MVTSEILCKTYKTFAAYKGQMTRAINQQRSHCADIKASILKGWDTYMGYPIHKYKRENDAILDALSAEYHSNERKYKSGTL